MEGKGGAEPHGRESTLQMWSGANQDPQGCRAERASGWQGDTGERARWGLWTDRLLLQATLRVGLGSARAVTP